MFWLLPLLFGLSLQVSALNWITLQALIGLSPTKLLSELSSYPEKGYSGTTSAAIRLTHRADNRS